MVSSKRSSVMSSSTSSATAAAATTCQQASSNVTDFVSCATANCIVLHQSHPFSCFIPGDDSKKFLEERLNYVTANRDCMQDSDCSLEYEDFSWHCCSEGYCTEDVPQSDEQREMMKSKWLPVNKQWFQYRNSLYCTKQFYLDLTCDPAKRARGELCRKQLGQDRPVMQPRELQAYCDLGKVTPNSAVVAQATIRGKCTAREIVAGNEPWKIVLLVVLVSSFVFSLCLFATFQSRMRRRKGVLGVLQSMAGLDSNAHVAPSLEEVVVQPRGKKPKERETDVLVADDLANDDDDGDDEAASDEELLGGMRLADLDDDAQELSMAEIAAIDRQQQYTDATRTQQS